MASSIMVSAFSLVLMTGSFEACASIDDFLSWFTVDEENKLSLAIVVRIGFGLALRGSQHCWTHGTCDNHLPSGSGSPV